MKKIFVTSDTHFNHLNMLKFETSTRGKTFKDVHEMNEVIIHNWNSVVSDEDIVYHLGDVYFGSSKEASEILSRLKGRKRLILGNHDNGLDQILPKFFEKILVSRIFKEFNAILTHIPVHGGSLNPDKYGRNIHGHIHDLKIDDSRYINVCVEKTNYFPVEISSL